MSSIGRLREIKSQVENSLTDGSIKPTKEVQQLSTSISNTLSYSMKYKNCENYLVKIIQGISDRWDNIRKGDAHGK